MASQPQSTNLLDVGCIFRFVAITLVVVNIVWHGVVALFIGGPFGLVIFVVAVILVWVVPFFLIRRWRAANAAPSPPVPPDQDSVGT